MNTFILSLVSTVFLLGSGSCFVVRQNSTDEKGSIVGGGILNGIAPYHVSLHCDDMYICGGALITRQHVLTAAHCLDTVKEKNCPMDVMVGSNHMFEGHPMEVESYVVHPDYRESDFGNDIAVLKLKHPVVLSQTIKTVPLTPYPPVHGESFSVTGYGRVHQYVDGYSDVLKQYSSNLLTYQQCRKQGGSAGKNDFCDHGNFNEGFCTGDSGGPAVNKYYLIGVVARFETNHEKGEMPKCAVGIPNTFTSVYYNLGFIKSSLML